MSIKMVENPSPIQYFAAARAHRQGALSVWGRDGSELERKVASCFVVAENISVHLAIAAVTGDVSSVERYLPPMHEALVHLKQFHLSLIIAPCYGAYTWPNVELKAFANFLAEIGIDMKYSPQLDGDGNNTPYSQISAFGVALLKDVNKIRELASGAYFFGEDLSRMFVMGWRWLRRAEVIFDELFAEALSAKALNGYGPQTDKLVSLIWEYAQVRSGR